MDIAEAVEGRHSVRNYKEQPIPEEIVAELNGMIDEINNESGLSVCLKLNEPAGFGGIKTRMTGFKNAVNYFAMIGPDDDTLNEKAGYYGEKLVIYSQQLGLNTCWAMFCSKKACAGDVKEGQRMVIGIAVGYGVDQGVPHKNKDISKIADMNDAPDWFVNGVHYAMLAPTGMNRQGFSFERDGNKVRLITKNSTLAQVDRGIVRYHFELGAGKEFEWM